MSACDDDDGSPTPPGEDVPGDRGEQGGGDDADAGGTGGQGDDPDDGQRDLDAEQGAEKVQDGGEREAEARRERAGRERGRDRVGGVVDAVGPREDRGQDEDGHQQGGEHAGSALGDGDRLQRVREQLEGLRRRAERRRHREPADEVTRRRRPPRRSP